TDAHRPSLFSAALLAHIAYLFLRLRPPPPAPLFPYTTLFRSSIEPGHLWPHIGQVRESGTFECDECDDSDLEVTVGSSGVRISCVPSSTHPYFRESALAALIDLGGTFDAKLHAYIAKRWTELSPSEKQVGWRTH